MPSAPTEPSSSLVRRTLFAVFLLGLAVSLWMAWRSQVRGDQLKFLVLGYEFWANDTLLPFGSGMSQGGLLPGSLSSLLSGLPLFVWSDYRSTSFFVVAMHVVAYWLLDRTLRGYLTPVQRILFGVFFWLNPWRVYHSAHIWNPNWIFLFAALHTWSLFRLRERASFAMTTVNVLSIGLAFQLHGSFLILAILSVLMWWRGYVRVHWLGVATGTVLTVATLIPWILAAQENPGILPIKQSFLGYGLVYVYPMIRGLSYLIRFPSMAYGRYMNDVEFTASLGPGWDACLGGFVGAFEYGIGIATMVLAFVALVVFWRRGRAGRPDPSSGRNTDSRWLGGFVRLGLISAGIAFALSPTTIMSYQVFIVLHVAVLVPVIVLGEQIARGTWPWLPRALTVHAILLLLISIAMSLGSPMYRRGDGHRGQLKIREPHPAIDALGIGARCDVLVDPVFGVSTDPLFHSQTRRELSESSDAR